MPVDEQPGRCDAAEVRAALSESLAAGSMTERFARLAVDVAAHYYRHERWKSCCDCMRREFESEFGLRLVRNWHKLDLRNPRAYLQHMARGAALDCLKRERRIAGRLREFQAFADEFGRMLDEGPDGDET